MAFKLMFCLAVVAVACVHARPGGPAAYSISAPSVDHASVGNTQEHTVKGHYGQSSQSDYASQVQTAHSQSHVQRSSISNDAGLAPAYGAIAASTHTALAPAATYSLAHTAPAAHGLSYATAAAPLASYGHSYATAPAYSYGIGSLGGLSGLVGHAGLSSLGSLGSLGSIGSYGSYGGYAATAPALQYSGGHLGYAAAAAPALSHGYLAAPAAATLKYAAAPAYAPGIIGHGIGLAAPAYAAPAIAAHIAAPVVKAAVAAPALVHTSVSGHGIHYGY